MADTRRFGAPLLEAGQAQKHVTVNEALTRLDALAGGVVRSRALSAPPAAPRDGDLYIVADGAVASWVGHDGMLALWDNGGWVFAAPVVGRRLWVEEEEAEFAHSGAHWALRDAGSRKGAGMRFEVLTIDHEVRAGISSLTAPIIPEKASVLAVTGRVLETLAGTDVTAWSLGVPGAADRYGGGYGLSAGSFAHGLTGQPLAYYAPTPLTIEASGGGAFSGGRIRLAVHCIRVDPPEAP
jgi:hypothetical protein